MCLTFPGISGAPMPGLDEEIANLAVAEVDRVLETYWWPASDLLVTIGDLLVTSWLAGD